MSTGYYDKNEGLDPKGDIESAKSTLIKVASLWAPLFSSEPEGSPFGIEAFEDRLQEYLSRIKHNEQSRNTTNQWQAALDSCQGTRRLFRTIKNYLGFGARSLRHDEVWILAGASCPMILRQIEHGRYQLIGEAYVHGLMHGEACDTNLELSEIFLV